MKKGIIKKGNRPSTPAFLVGCRSCRKNSVIETSGNVHIRNLVNEKPCFHCGKKNMMSIEAWGIDREALDDLIFKSEMGMTREQFSDWLGK